MEEQDDQDQDFAVRVARICEMAGGAAELARRSGLSRRVIDKYIAGGSDPSRQRLVRLAAAADVSLQWLATGKGAAQDGSVMKAPPIDRDLFFLILRNLKASAELRGGRELSVNELEIGRAFDLYEKIDALGLRDPESRYGALKMALAQMDR